MDTTGMFNQGHPLEMQSRLETAQQGSEGFAKRCPHSFVGTYLMFPKITEIQLIIEKNDVASSWTSSAPVHSINISLMHSCDLSSFWMPSASTDPLKCGVQIRNDCRSAAFSIRPLLVQPKTPNHILGSYHMLSPSYEIKLLHMNTWATVYVT